MEKFLILLKCDIAKNVHIMNIVIYKIGEGKWDQQNILQAWEN